MLQPQAERLLIKAAQKVSLSIRGYTKVIKVAQSIADFDQAPVIYETHIAQALQLRLEKDLLT